MGHASISVKACFTVLGILLNIIIVPSLSFAAPPPLLITCITPSGTDVPTGRQIVFQFDRPVVPIGRMVRKASACSNFLGPIDITPSLDCWTKPLCGGKKLQISIYSPGCPIPGAFREGV